MKNEEWREQLKREYLKDRAEREEGAEEEIDDVAIVDNFEKDINHNDVPIEMDNIRGKGHDDDVLRDPLHVKSHNVHELNFKDRVARNEGILIKDYGNYVEDKIRLNFNNNTEKKKLGLKGNDNTNYKVNNEDKRQLNFNNYKEKKKPGLKGNNNTNYKVNNDDLDFKDNGNDNYVEGEEKKLDFIYEDGNYEAENELDLKDNGNNYEENDLKNPFQSKKDKKVKKHSINGNKLNGKLSNGTVLDIMEREVPVKNTNGKDFLRVYDLTTYIDPEVNSFECMSLSINPPTKVSVCLFVCLFVCTLYLKKG